MLHCRPLICFLFALACSPAFVLAADVSDGNAFTGPGGRPIEGLTQPGKRVVLKAPLVATVERVAIEEAQPIEADQLLVQLDAAVQQAVVRRAEAALAQTKYILTNTRRLRNSDAATAFELRTAELEAEQARATVALERARLDRYQLRVPFDGRVIRIHSREGATVSDETPVVTVAQLDPLKAELHLPAKYYDRIVVGRAYRFAASVPVERTLVGRCKTIEPIIDSASRTFRCVFTIDNSDAAMPAGFKVQLLGPTNARHLTQQ